MTNQGPNATGQNSTGATPPPLPTQQQPQQPMKPVRAKQGGFLRSLAFSAGAGAVSTVAYFAQPLLSFYAGAFTKDILIFGGILGTVAKVIGSPAGVTLVSGLAAVRRKTLETTSFATGALGWGLGAMAASLPASTPYVLGGIPLTATTGAVAASLIGATTAGVLARPVPGVSSLKVFAGTLAGAALSASAAYALVDYNSPVNKRARAAESRANTTQIEQAKGSLVDSFARVSPRLTTDPLPKANLGVKAPVFKAPTPSLGFRK